MVKRTGQKKDEGTPFTFTRMLCGHRWQLFQTLTGLGFSDVIGASFIERLNLTLRQGIAALSRRTWSLAKSQEALLLRLHWWQSFYHFARPHSQ